MILNNACGYYGHICKCIHVVAYLLNYTYQSKFSLLIYALNVTNIIIIIIITDYYEYCYY